MQLQAGEEMLQFLKLHLQPAQLRMKVQVDKHRIDEQYNIGDWVFLKLQPYKQNYLADKQYKKLSARYFEPYQIEDRIGVVACKLVLPVDPKCTPFFTYPNLKNNYVPPTI